MFRWNLVVDAVALRLGAPAPASRRVSLCDEASGTPVTLIPMKMALRHWVNHKSNDERNCRCSPIVRGFRKPIYRCALDEHMHALGASTNSDNGSNTSSNSILFRGGRYGPPFTKTISRKGDACTNECGKRSTVREFVGLCCPPPPPPRHG